MIAACLALAIRVGATPTDDRNIAALEREYHCRIVATLLAIHRHPMSVKHRYAIFSAQKHKDGYVHCIFFDNDRQIHCEAASGYYNKNLVVPTVGLAILALLGFSSDGSKGNFSFDRHVDKPGAIDRIATIILQALGRVYGMDRRELLTVKAPLARTLSGAECAPLISLRNIKLANSGSV